MSAAQFSLFEAPPAVRQPMLRDAPAPLASVPMGTITARDYQVRADAAIDEALSRNRSTLVTMATGAGKTVLFALQARKRGGALVIAHEQSLIDQAAQKLRHVTGEAVAVEKAERAAWTGAKYIVASMQTLRGDRLRFFAQQHAGVEFIVIDEAHRALAKSYRDIIAAFPHAKVLGVTATADRGDKKALASVFETVAYRYDIADATADGWLTPFEWFPMDVTGVSLDSVGLKGGDLDQDALDEQVVLQAAQIAQSMHAVCKGMRTVAFTPGVQTAIVGAEALNRLEPGCARAIHGAMPDHEKAAIKAAHARGDFPYLLNCAILIEGYDDARLHCIVDLAKTKSRARFAQKLGRGGRLWPSGIDHLTTPGERRAAIAVSPKPTCKFFDANYGAHGHTLAGPVDLLGGRYDDETKERAKKKLAEQGGDVAAALDEAKAELDAEKAKKLARAAAAAAKAKGKVLVGAARAACELFGVSTEIDTSGPRAPEEMIAATTAYLIKNGVDNAAKMPWQVAREMEREFRSRSVRGMSSNRQIKSLTRRGVENAKALTFAQASRLMEVVGPHNSAQDWGWTFAPGQVDAILGRRS